MTLQFKRSMEGAPYLLASNGGENTLIDYHSAGLPLFKGVDYACSLMPGSGVWMKVRSSTFVPEYDSLKKIGISAAAQKTGWSGEYDSVNQAIDIGSLSDSQFEELSRFLKALVEFRRSSTDISGFLKFIRGVPEDGLYSGIVQNYFQCGFYYSAPLIRDDFINVVAVMGQQLDSKTPESVRIFTTTATQIISADTHTKIEEINPRLGLTAKGFSFAVPYIKDAVYSTQVGLSDQVNCFAIMLKCFMCFVPTAVYGDEVTQTAINAVQNDAKYKRLVKEGGSDPLDIFY